MSELTTEGARSDVSPSSPGHLDLTTATACSNSNSTAVSHIAGIRRSAVLSHSQALELCQQHQSPDSGRAHEPAAAADADVVDAADDDNKPVVNNVKLVSKDLHAMTISRYGTRRREKWSRAKRDPGRPSDDSCLADGLSSQRPSSTFSHLPMQNVYIGLCDYQTLLRPTHIQPEQPRDPADVSPGDDDVIDGDPVTSYDALTSRGDDTLRAIAVITDKYDSFRRRQHRVQSFLAARVSRSCSRESTMDNSCTSHQLVPRHSSTTTTAGTVALRLRTRVATDHALALALPAHVAPEVLAGCHVTEAEVDRVRLFYSSQCGQVVVCRSLADVYLGTVAGAVVGTSVAAAGRGAEKLRASDSVARCCWVHLNTGIPLLVLSLANKLVGRHRRLTLIVADRSTGLALWQDRITSMSAFRQIHPSSSGLSTASPGASAPPWSDPSPSSCGSMLTMRVSGALSKRVRLDVFSSSAASELMTAYRSLTADPDDELWKVSLQQQDDDSPPADDGNKSVSHRRTKKRRDHVTNDRTAAHIKALTAGDVSQPCEPRWVTRVDATDSNFRSAFAQYLPSLGAGSTGAVRDAEFRPRLPTN